jgi:hypothetical protein
VLFLTLWFCWCKRWNRLLFYFTDMFKGICFFFFFLSTCSFTAEPWQQHCPSSLEEQG